MKSDTCDFNLPDKSFGRVLLGCLLFLVICASSVYAQALYKNLDVMRQNNYLEDAQLALAAYPDATDVPAGYRKATQREFNELIGDITSLGVTMVKYDEKTGHFEGRFLSGLDGSLLIKEKDDGSIDSVVLAFSGSEGRFIDWNDDFLQAMGYVPAQYSLASEMLGNLINNTNGSRIPIKVVGHSLGGGLAAYATLNNDVSRVTTTTFNTAGLHKNNINKENKQLAEQVITNVYAKDELVSQHLPGQLVGQTCEVTNYNSDDYSKYGYFEGKINKLMDNAEAHSLVNLIYYMKRDMNDGYIISKKETQPGDSGNFEGVLPLEAPGGKRNNGGKPVVTPVKPIEIYRE